MSDVRLKICGIKSAGEARLVHGLPIDYLGLNFIASSSRYLALDTARVVVDELPKGRAKLVGLFAGQPLEEVNNYVRQLGLDYVQLHGDEPADYARAVEAPVMRAIAVNPDEPPEVLVDFIKHFPADYIVLDRQLQGRGEAVSVDLAAQIIAGTGKRIFYAGGLAPHNLGEVLAKIQPYGIDIAGGVRDSNGKLDITKIQNCLKAIQDF